MKGPKIKPLGDRVIILPTPAETETAGGIVIPETARARINKGTVISINDDNKIADEGDEVMYHPGSGVDIEIDGKKHLVMKNIDLIAIL